MGATHTFGVSGWVCVKVTVQFKGILIISLIVLFLFSAVRRWNYVHTGRMEGAVGISREPEELGTMVRGDLIETAFT